MQTISGRIASAITALLVCCLLGVSPATQPSAVDVLAPLVKKVQAKALNQSVVLVIRPDLSLSFESPSVVAAIRDVVVSAMQGGNVKLVTSDAADVLLRDAATAGQPTVPAILPVLAAADSDLVLCGVVHRSGDLHRVAFTLVGRHGAITQMSVVLNVRSITVTGDDIELAQAAIDSAVQPVVTKCVGPVQAADVKTLVLIIRPETAEDTATAGFEMALYDSVSASLHQNQIDVQSPGKISIGIVKPSTVASLSDLPADTAVALLTYHKRAGGMLVKLLLVSAKAQLATATAGVDNWDVAAMPVLPVLNMKVLAFSEAQRGKKVGNGECWTLAAEALNDARARRANGYTFGRKLAVGETVYPGDIMQFTSARFEGRDGNRTWWMQLGSPNHTAVVRRVLGPLKYEILEQNPGPVMAATINFKDLKSGSYETWRPVAR